MEYYPYITKVTSNDWERFSMYDNPFDIPVDETSDDSVNRPPHYVLFEGRYEVIHLIEDRLFSLRDSDYAPLNPIVYSHYANVLKYACRWMNKGGVEDLKKLLLYLNWLIEEYENVV